VLPIAIFGRDARGAQDANDEPVTGSCEVVCPARILLDAR
jgi:hypothetical protein